MTVDLKKKKKKTWWSVFYLVTEACIIFFFGLFKRQMLEFPKNHVNIYSQRKNKFVECEATLSKREDFSPTLHIILSHPLQTKNSL